MSFKRSTDANNDARAWLYELLAKLERYQIDEAIKTEISSSHITLDFKFKAEPPMDDGEEEVEPVKATTAPPAKPARAPVKQSPVQFQTACFQDFGLKDASAIVAAIKEAIKAEYNNRRIHPPNLG